MKDAESPNKCPICNNTIKSYEKVVKVKTLPLKGKLYRFAHEDCMSNVVKKY